MSTFGSFNTAVTGLAASQRSMDAVGQNIVNANTPGYSRQRVNLAAAGGPTSATFHSGTNEILGGVKVIGVDRIHDVYVEATRAAAGARQQALTTQNSVLTEAQTLLAEPGDTGMQNALDSFYAAWHDLSMSPTNGAAGSVVIQRANAVADQVRDVSTGIGQTWNTARANLQNTVTQANQAAKDLAALNSRIQQASISGNAVNTLKDQRDLLVRTIADLVGGYAVPAQDGTVSVSVNGITVVSGPNAETLTLTGATDITGALTDPPTIRWQSTGVPIESGAAAGYLATLRTDLPSLQSQVDGVATSLRDAVNGVHQSGYQLDGTPGTEFFTGTSASTLRVVPTQPEQIAVASAPGVVDGATALRIGDLSDDARAATALSGQPGPSARWRSLTTSYGVSIQSLQNATKVQDAVVSAADSAVQADSGVNIDEEMTNMLLYQRSYQASARVISTIDSMLDTLINRTGLGG